MCVQLETIPREFLCVISAHRKFLVEAPELHKIIPARKPCVADVAGGLIPKQERYACNHLGPTVSFIEH